MISTGLGFGKGGRIFWAASAPVNAGVKQRTIAKLSHAMRLMRWPLTRGLFQCTSK